MSKDKINYKAHVSEWKTSGLSKSGYCKMHEISYHTFMYHCKQLQKSESKSSFVQVGISSGINGSPIEFHFKNGSYFVFPADCTADKIKSVIF